jgi:hypothetical protein
VIPVKKKLDPAEPGQSVEKCKYYGRKYYHDCYYETDKSDESDDKDNYRRIIYIIITMRMIMMRVMNARLSMIITSFFNIVILVILNLISS